MVKTIVIEDQEAETLLKGLAWARDFSTAAHYREEYAWLVEKIRRELNYNVKVITQ